MADQKPTAIEQRGLARLFYAAALTLLVGYVLYIGRGIFIPLVIAIFLSFIIVTLKSGIRRIPFVGRILPEFLAYILAFSVIAFIVIILGQIITANAGAIIQAAPEYQARLRGILDDIGSFLEGLPFFTDWIVSNVEDAENTVSEDGSISREGYAALLTQFQQQVLSFVSGFASEIGQAIRALAQNIVTIFLYTSFMLLERGAILKKLGIMAGMQEARLDISQITDDIGTLVRQYISIKTLMGLTTATFSFIIMTLLGIDFAGFWALLIFALGYIPIIGAISGVMLPSILALVQPDGGGVTLFLLTLGLLTAAEQTVSSVIEPRLMGRSLNLSPLIILLSLTFWGTLWGFAGMLLCVPITVSIMIVCSQFQDTRPIAVMLSDNGEISPIKRMADDMAEGDSDQTSKNA